MTKKTKIISGVVVATIMVGFGIFFISSISSKSSNNTPREPIVASVNGIEISEAELTLLNGGRKPTPEEKMRLLNAYANQLLIASTYAASDPDTERVIATQIKSQAALSNTRKAIADKISSKEIKEFYENNVTSASYDAYAVDYYLSQDKNDAENVIAEIAKSGSSQKLEPVKIGKNTDEDYILRAQLPYGLAGIIPKAKVGWYSETPIYTIDGWLVVQLKGKKDGVKPTESSLRQDILNYLADQKVANYVAGLRSKADIRLK